MPALPYDSWVPKHVILTLLGNVKKIKFPDSIFVFKFSAFPDHFLCFTEPVRGHPVILRLYTGCRLDQTFE